MNRKVVMLVLCLVAGSVMAGGSARFGNKLVSTGDAAGKVTQVAGRPDRVIQLETDFSGNIGERWEYYKAQKTIHIIFRDGKVTEVNELYN
ncbi:hypothetical protein [Stenotrophomonas chelatiphaga]|uniref:hypothetical protein n=1 Tax=Stenotrophomonas chelatiphaga TaxID=517011 RepID=UPI0028970824|nr:hypothetical protein [Stenotrophomonas chelatiphaga]